MVIRGSSVGSFIAQLANLTGAGDLASDLRAAVILDSAAAADVRAQSVLDQESGVPRTANPGLGLAAFEFRCTVTAGAADVNVLPHHLPGRRGAS